MQAHPVIGIFDSGVGGLTVLKAIRAALPAAELLYCADNLHLPYGTKTTEEVTHCTLTATKELLAKKPLDLLVIACNTASTAALATLRQTYSIPIVGVVPAVKRAAALTKTGTIGLLATPGTVLGSYADQLIRDFAANCRVIKTGSHSLVRCAERKLRGEAVDLTAIKHELTAMFAASPKEEAARLDMVVLGCTHFPWLVPELTQAAPWPVSWIDSSDAVASRVSALLKERGFLMEGATTTGPTTAFFSLLDDSVEELRATLAGFGCNTCFKL